MRPHFDGLKSVERGLSLSSKAGVFRIALCFPGEYSWGMANLGYQTLLRLVFEAPHWRGERFFSHFGPYSLETRAPLAAFDLLAFSLSFETDVFRLVALLQAGKIPVFFSQREDDDPWVIVGGPLATLNPEIVAPFADLVFIGEAEEVFPQLLTLWVRGKKARCSRIELKKSLSALPGVYVPQGIIPIYRDGDLVGFEVEDGFSAPVERQRVPLDDFETRTFLYAPSAYFRETALLEINRGCGYRCRFCAGSYLYAPLRQRSFWLVLAMLDRVSTWTNRVGFLGSDVLSHPHFEEILTYLVKQGKEVTCSSLSARRLLQNESLLTLLRKGGLRTLTMAPESGGCRMRHFLGKGLENEEWMALVERAVALGFERIKLYFMLGKPGEGVEEDIALVETMATTVPPARLAVSYSFLVPKPHTLFEDFAPPPLAVWKREKEVFEKAMRKLKITVSGESSRFAFLELLLARGDRLMAEKIPQVLSQGGGMAAWRKAFRELRRDLHEWARGPWKGTVRPWSMVSG